MIESNTCIETTVGTGKDQHGRRWKIVRYQYDTMAEHYLELGGSVSIAIDRRLAETVAATQITNSAGLQVGLMWGRGAGPPEHEPA